MGARESKNARRSRAENERARRYAARTSWHESRISRRTRDNTIAGVVGGIIVICAIASQSVHAVVFAPEPEPTATAAPAPLENPFATLFPTAPAAE